MPISPRVQPHEYLHPSAVDATRDGNEKAERLQQDIIVARLEQFLRQQVEGRPLNNQFLLVESVL